MPWRSVSFNQPKSWRVRDAIIHVLSTDFPQNLKTLHISLQKKYDLEVSSQAVHKVAHELAQQGILNKSTLGYCLNEVWIRELKVFSTESEKRYHFHGGFPTIRDHEQLTIQLSTLAELDEFFLCKLEAYAKTSLKSQKALACVQHLWWPIFYSYREYQQLKTILTKVDVFIACKGKTGIDDYCGKFYQDFGVKVKLGSKNVPTHDLYVMNDYVIEVFYPASVQKKIKDYYQRFHSLHDFNKAQYYTKLFEKPTPITLSISKNPEWAKTLFDEFT